MTDVRSSPSPVPVARARHARVQGTSGITEARWRPALRLALAIGIGLGLADLLWRHIGTHLSVTTDIVGRTTFADFDIYRYLDRFDDITIALPVFTILAYLLVAHVGPLRAPPASRPWPPTLEGAEPDRVDPHDPVGQRRGIAASHLLWPLWALTRIALPALTAGIEINAASSTHNQTLTEATVYSALAYAVVVMAAAVVLITRRRARTEPGVTDSGTTRSDRWRPESVATDLSMVNAITSIAVIPLLVTVSWSTAVTVVSDNHVAHYGWFPMWIGAIATVVAVAIAVRSLLRSHDPRSCQLIERRVLLVVVVPVLLFMISAQLPGAQGPFNGFDDAQAMVGGQLSFGHGLWPWRDIFLLHGFLTDDLYGAIGLLVFSVTRWGSNAGVSFFVAPFTIVGLFAFIVYFARRNRLLIVVGTFALLLGLLPGWSITRYVFLPVVLILFDRVLRKGSWGRCILFVGSVIFISIITPETTVIMLGILGTLILAEVVHRSPRQRLVDSFSRTIRCAVAGTAMIAVWVVFLAVTHTLSGFIAYYQTTVSGHELWGAYSPEFSPAGNPLLFTEFALPIALFLLTIWKVVVKLRRRSPWRPIEWVLVASATPVVLFYQVVLDRMDGGHVNEVFQTLIPFVVLWGFELVTSADAVVFRSINCVVRRWRANARFPVTVPITFLAIFAIALGSPYSLTAWKDIPAEFHPSVPVPAPSDLPLGYTLPGTIDVAQINDLGKVLDHYAGRNGPVFDFTNEMGITYFLLNRVPGARFYHVESAQTAKAQDLEVSDLERSRPRVVIFNDITFGLPNYDGIWSMERNYIVSQYILDHYRPLLDTHGQLVLLRDDLFSTAKPLPRLSAPPVTSGLYFDMPSCDWGYVPNFLIHPTPESARGGLTLQATSTGLANLVTISGWAFDTPDDQPARSVLVVSRGRVVGAVTPSLGRTDVAAILNTQVAETSGFEIEFPLARGASYRLFVLNADNSVTPLPVSRGERNSGPLPASVTTPDGVVHPLRGPAWEGNLDSTTTAQATRSFTVQIPPGTDLGSYEWLETLSRSGFGRSRIELTDAVQDGTSHMIAFNTLPMVGDSVFTRVGSCLQWHGYDTSTLTLLVNGPPKDLTVRLLK